MGRYADLIKEKSPLDLFFTWQLALWQGGSADSRYGKIKRALASGEIESLRRGLYILAHRHRRKLPNLFELAHYIYGPSYVSCESALSFWGLIPERVCTVASMTSKRSASFSTSFGLFSYQHFSSWPLFHGVERISEGGDVFFMASPLKALLDYVWEKKLHIEHPLHWVEHSLRIDERGFISLKELHAYEDYYKGSHVNAFIQTLKKEL